MKKKIILLAAILKNKFAVCSLQFAICISLLTANCLLPTFSFGQNFSFNTTGATNTTLSMVEVLQISTTATSRGLYVLHSGTIAGTGYGIWAEKTGGAGTTNIAGYFTASGLGTNYGLWVNAGEVRFVPLVSGVNGAILRTNSSGDLSITNFSGAASDVLLGTGVFGTAVTSGTAWQLVGNSLAGTEFIGSTNAQPFMMRTSNVERARILSAGNFLINGTTALYATDAFEVYGTATFPDAINGYTSVIGGTAVFGRNTAGGASVSIYGDINSATGFGIQGFNSNASGTGIIGVGNNIGGSYLTGGSGGAFTSTNVGVYGYGNNTAASYGVYGVSANATGIGIFGLATVNSGTGIYAYNNVAAGTSTGAALEGWSGQNGGGTSNAALNMWHGDATGGTAIAGGGNNLGIIALTAGSGGTFYGQVVGIYGRSAQTGTTQNSGVYGYCGSFARGTYLSLYNGTYYKTIATGAATNSCAVPDLNENMVCMHAPETPEAYFQDFGQGQLINGRVHIELDPVFAKNVTINEKHPLRVFIQLEGDCNGVYITNKTTTGFDVVELRGGNSNTPFQWFVTCNMADSKGENGLMSKFADLRFEPAPKDLETKEAKSFSPEKIKPTQQIINPRPR